MRKQYDKLINILREMFQMDQAELDFGIYRIMNQKKDELEKFFTDDLLPQVQTEFSKYKDAQAEDKKKELKELEDALRKAKVNPDENEEVKKLRKEISGFSDEETLAGEVFSHLATFFRRYYDGGDFMSLRRYKKDTYAIPYEGEEVKLYWANYDQYYIKSSEYLKDYTFKISGGKRVHFKLVDATQEKDNVKESNGKERRFKLYQHEPFKIDGNELFIQFVYLIDKEKQKTLNTQTLEFINGKLGSLNEFQDIFSKVPTQKNKNRTLLEKHLETYTARFNFDFFIHKDLGGFLRRELDFFIKNEILFIDDLDEHDIQKLKTTVAKVKVMKHIAHKIIDMLSQLEDFQKKLWLKKKFVTNCGYCVTLDRVPQQLYPQIIANNAQREEWIKLFAIDEIKTGYSNPLTVDFLKTNPYLVLDTKHFDEQFKEKLLASFDNIDQQCDGVIINSENFQALGLLQEKYRQKIKCIYIDPPYNTDASEIIYKNGYKHSSWNSLLADRMKLGKTLLDVKGFNATTIDYAEILSLGNIKNQVFGENNRVGIVTIFINPKGRQHERFFSASTEYMFVYANDINLAKFNKTTIDSKKCEQFNLKDSKGFYRLDEFARIRSSTKRTEKPNFWYPIYVSPDLKTLTLEKRENYYTVFPIGSDGEEYSWKVIPATFKKNNKESLYVAELQDTGKIIIFNKFYEQQVYQNLWHDKKYFPEFQGTNLVKSILGTNIFSYPKSIYAVMDTLKIMSNPVDILIDYFAGSGTTAHAVINLNREDNGNRKYILVEMGQYFDTVLKPRIQKVIYSKDWKDGKPVSREGSSHMFKYMKLESYEDTLDNLIIKRTPQQELALNELSSETKEGYMLRYFLDVETRGSDSLLNIDKFSDPFNYTLRIRQDNELQEQKIDLVETFNYLIGLYVEQTEVIRGFKVIRGRLRTGEKTLVIWRNTNEKDNDALNEFFLKQGYNTLDFEFDRIYVNGDNNLENLKVDEDKWKVVMIEEEFKKRMFDVREI